MPNKPDNFLDVPCSREQDVMPKAFMEELFTKGKTFALLSRRGVLMEINGQQRMVCHNKVKGRALLRIVEPEKQEQLRLVLLEEVYKGKNKEYVLPQITDNPKIVFDLKGEWNGQEGSITLDFSQRSDEELLNLIHNVFSVCDAPHDIKKFVIKWGQNVEKLLGHAMLDQVIGGVGVNVDGDLVVSNLNRKYQDKEPKTDNQGSQSIFRVIAEREGAIKKQEAGDIQIYLENQNIRSYVEALMHITQNDIAHPEFQKLKNLFVDTLLQVKTVRDKIQHLVPLQKDEKIRIVIDGKNASSIASYYSKAGIRKDRRHCQLEQAEQGACRFHEGSYKFDQELGILEIQESSLIAELRHHIHYLCTCNHEKVSYVKELGLPIWSAVTEFIDELGHNFPQRIMILRDKRIAGLIRERIDKKESVWRFLSVFDDISIKDHDGHAICAYTLDKLASLVYEHFQGEITDEQLQEIDKIVWDYLLSLDLDSHVQRKRALLSGASFCNHMILAKAPLAIYQEQLDQFYASLPDGVPKTEKTLAKFADMKELRDRLVVMFDQNGLGDIRQMVRIMFGAMKYEDFLSEFVPFIDSDGRVWPTQMACVLDPDVIFEEIKKQFVLRRNQ